MESPIPPRRRTTRRVVWVLASLAAIGTLVGVAEIVAGGVTLTHLRPRIERDLEQALGLDVSIGRLHLSLLPTPSLEAEDVRVANPPGRATPHLLVIGSLELGVSLWPPRFPVIALESLEIRDVELNLEPDAEGRYMPDVRTAELVDDADEQSDGIDLELRLLRATDLRIFQRDAESGEVRSLELDIFELETDGLDTTIALALSGRMERGRFDLEGSLGSLRELQTATAPYPVSIRGRVFEASVELEGTIVEPMTLGGVDLEITARLPELRFEGEVIPGVGALSFRAQLSDLDGSMGLEHFELTAQLGANQALGAVEGRVDDLLDLTGVEVAAQLDSVQLDFLDPLFGVDIPPLDSATGVATLSDADGTLGLRGALHVETLDGGVELHAEGEYGDFSRIGDIGIQVRASARELSSLRDLVAGIPELPALGPIEVSGSLKDRDGLLRVDGLALKLGSREDVWLFAEGEIANLLELSGIEIELEFGSTSSQRLARAFGREIPELGHIDGHARISDRDGSLGIEDGQLRVTGAQGVELVVDATLGDVFELDEIEFDLELRAPDLALIGALAGRALPSIRPVEIATRLRGSDERLSALSARIRLGETRIEASIEASFPPDQRPRVSAAIYSRHVRLQDLGVIPASDALPEEPEDDAGGEAKLPFRDLRSVDLDLDLRFDHVSGYAGLEISDLSALIQLEDGRLVIEDLEGQYQDGRLKSSVRVDSTQPIPEVVVDIDARGIDVGKLMSQFEADTDYSGLIDLELQIEGQGETTDALRRSLAGRMRFVLRDGTAASKFAREFTVNLARAAFPGTKTEKSPRIGCAVVAFEIVEGIAIVEQLLIEEGEITVTGEGEVDLIEGVYRLEFTPSTTNPGILSVTPRVRVLGALDQPSFKPVTRTLATSLIGGLGKNVRKLGLAILDPFRSRREEIDAGEAACGRVGTAGQD